jgi:hypothetical protein
MANEQTTTEESMAYIARKPCGCIVMAIMDMPDIRELIAERVGEAISEGLTVQRVPARVVREQGWGCKCGETGNLFEAKAPGEAGA